MRWTKLAAAVLLLATSATASHARMFSGSCTRGGHSVACNFSSVPSPSAEPHIIIIPNARDDWSEDFQQRCDPQLYLDGNGISRWLFAHKSCGGDTTPRP